MEAFEQDLGLKLAVEYSYDGEQNLVTSYIPWNAWNLIFPVVFVFGVAFIITYVTNMVVRFESKTVWKADRMYVAYQIVFIAVLAVTIWRWFLVNMSNPLYPSIVMLISGIITLLTPRIIDNNNDEF